MFVLARVNMLPIKLLVALAAVYDGILYVLQPPNCTSASITYAHNVVNNTTWYKMDTTVLTDINVFKIPVRTFTENDVLTFKIKFHYPTYAADTNWQTIMLNPTKPDVLQKAITEDPHNYCCISTIILGSTLLITLSLCFAYFFIFWSLNYNTAG